MTFDVFISYSSRDKSAADAACAALEAANIRCWIAPRDVSLGRDYGESIIEAIESAKAFVLIFSSSANDSPQIKREVERAVTKGLPIIPVRIEDVLPTRALEYFISSQHWLDAFPPPRERYFATLVESLRALLAAGRPAAPENVADTRPVKSNNEQIRHRRLGLRIGLAAAAFVLITAGAAVLYSVESRLLVQTLTGHGADADSIAFSPDSKLIAAGGWDATVHIWSVENGQLQGPLISGFFGHDAPFSPDGKWIAGGSDSDVKIWDASSKRVVKTLPGHSAKVQTVAFSPDGRLLVSGGKDGALMLWDLAGNAPGLRLGGHDDEVYSVAFSSDGKRVASAGFDRRVVVWDVARGQPVTALGGTNKMTAAVFSPDDAWLATAGWDGSVRVWDTSNWQVVRVMPGSGQIVMTLAFSPNGKLLASAGFDDTVNVWDLATGAVVRTYTGHSGTVWAVGFSPNGKWIASASSDKTVKIWKAP